MKKIIIIKGQETFLRYKNILEWAFQLQKRIVKSFNNLNKEFWILIYLKLKTKKSKLLGSLEAQKFQM